MLRNIDDISLTIILAPRQLQLLQVAIWFHDIVYIVPSENGQNECSSALRAREFCLDARESGAPFKLVRTLSLDDTYYIVRRGNYCC